MNNNVCYEGRIDRQIMYVFSVHRSNNYISMTYAKYAGILNCDIPVYHKFRDTNDVRLVKKICADDANSEDRNFLAQYKDFEFYDMHERSSKLIEDTDKFIKELKSKTK